MSRPLRLAPAHALETAIELTKRLGDAGGAQLLAIEPTPQETTVHLAIPAEGAVGIRRLRRQLWISFVDRSIDRRNSFERLVTEGLDQRRAGLERSRIQAERVHRFILERGAR